MKSSYNWLKDFVDVTVPPKELAHILTMAGFEVEAIEEFEGDTIFDIGVTPNRPDCLSMRGIAREISAILDIPLKEITVTIDKEEGEGPVVEVKNPELCRRYSSRIVRGIAPGPSPEWLSKRLESCGIRPTSNIVDITNYVLLELGQPMHAFDFEKLSGGKIIVREAGDTTTFTTLDDEERKLSKEMLLIWDGEKPVAVAGVMGGQNTEVSESTKNIFIESAFFAPSSVRRTSRKLNLSTESSYRFERGVDAEAVTFALDRAAQMISEIAGGQISSVADHYPEPFQTSQVTVSLNKINSTIGVTFEESFIVETLKSLGCTVERAGDGIVVTPPGFRQDIQRDIDIIEEIARLYGYDNIPSTLPVMQMSAAPEHETQELVKNLKICMIKSGFSEAVNFSFLNPETLDTLNVPLNDRRRDLVSIKNPLRKEESVMRTSLVPALLNNVSLNLSRGEKMLRLFEISNVFFHSGEKLPREIIQMAAVCLRGNESALWLDRHEGFYDLKGALENIFISLKIEKAYFLKDGSAAEPYLHPGKSGSIMIENEKIGSIGVLHPSVAGAFDIRGDITVAELYDIEKVRGAVPSKENYVPLPRFPYAERDVAIVVGDDVTVSAVRNEILDNQSDIVESVNLFDVYKGKPIPEDKKSLAFSIRFRSAERTLTDKEVDDLHTDIIKRLQRNLNADLR